MRWNPSGDKLVSASFDKTTKLLDFKTGKLLYTGKTSDESKLSISKDREHHDKFYRTRPFCMLHLDNNECKGSKEEVLARMLAEQHNLDNDSVN